jgi:hypothetical protein
MTPKLIVERLEQVLGREARPVRLVSAIEIEMMGHFGLTAIEAAEKAEATEDAVAKAIESRALTANLNGVPTILSIVGTGAYTIAGACHVLPTDTPAIAAAKSGRRHQEDILSKIRSLNFSQFETFGKRILHELGALNPHVTPHGNDQGIDFFGEFSLGQVHDLPRPFLQLAHDVRLLFAGQAKHYPHRTIGPNIVRELVGAVSLARTKTFSQDGLDIFKDLEIRPFSPVVALLFTTGEITSGAVRLAASSGIVAKNGRQLASFLADRGVGVQTSAGGSAFSSTLFDSWLAG